LPPPTSDFEKGWEIGGAIPRSPLLFKNEIDNYMTCTKRLTPPKLDDGLMEKANVFEAVKDER